MLHFVALHFIVLHCIALYCIVFVFAFEGRDLEGLEDHDNYVFFTHLIFVTHGVSLKKSTECKRNPNQREKYCFGLSLSTAVNVLFFAEC